MLSHDNGSEFAGENKQPCHHDGVIMHLPISLAERTSRWLCSRLMELVQYRRSKLLTLWLICKAALCFRMLTDASLVAKISSVVETSACYSRTHHGTRAMYVRLDKVWDRCRWRTCLSACQHRSITCAFTRSF